MAHEKKGKKKGYEGFKLKHDNRGEREARAKRNAQGAEMTNEMFALKDTHFIEACERASVKPTKRQASKFRNAYGRAARAAGKNTRKDPSHAA